MSVITFVNNIEEQTGKTLSAVAIATNMAINNNNSILLLSTSKNEDRITNCFFQEKDVKTRLGLFQNVRRGIDEESGLDGLLKMARSNKLTPDLITNYTRVIFRDRLEIIAGTKMTEETEQQSVENAYPNIINNASMYYDRVIVDLDNNTSKEVRDRIIDASDLIVLTTSQNFSSIKKIKENKALNDLLKSPKTLILIGRYDKDSKYNVKNISKYLEEKNKVLSVPYNTLYFEASNEGNVPDLFLRLRRLKDQDDKNAIFIQEVQRATESILYRLQALQVRR